ncbi:MAG: nitronate monooxygenase [Micrococcales bacterium]|nr:nitronate monooxygenase [Micrococcales bacterium]
MDIADLAVPVVAAPMAGGPSTPELAAAVGEAGGLGFLGAGHLSVEQLAEQIAQVWSLTSRPFGVNLFVPAAVNTFTDSYAVSTGSLVGSERVRSVARYAARLQVEAERIWVELPEPRGDDTDMWERTVDLVVRERVPVVSFTFGLPPRAVIVELRTAGITTVATVTDVEEARAAVAAHVDWLCVQGPGAGGHRGTLDEAKEPGSLDLVDLVRAVRAETDRPIVAAGGIGDPERAATVRAAGADAVQLGTAFLLTPEAGTALAHRRALTDPGYSTTVATRAFTGRLARALETDFVRAHHAEAPAAFPEVSQLTGVLRRASAQADSPDLMALWAGTGWRSAKPVPAAVVVAEFAAALR